VTGNNVQFSNAQETIAGLYLGIGSDPISGILSPGESGTVSVSYIPQGNGLIYFNVEQLQPNDVIDWESIKQSSKPEDISDTAWEAIWQNLQDSVGTTVAEFQAKLVEDANYLSQLGEVSNGSNLLNFELKQAANNLQNPQLISTTDLIDGATGFDLTLTRTFYQSIDRRYESGVFGRGWTYQWDIKADIIPNYVNNLGYFPPQEITVSNGDGSQQIFYLNESPYFTFDLTGAGGTLLKDVVNYVNQTGATLEYRTQTGEFQVQQTDGAIAAFANDGKLAYLEDTNHNHVTLNYTADRLTSLVHTDGSSLNLSYNSQGNINQITTSTGESSTYTYDSSGEYLLSVTNNQGTTNYTYDTGNIAPKKYALLSITSDEGYQRNFTYDDRGRLIQSTSNDGSEALSYSYDAGKITITDSSGATGSLYYDASGKLLQSRIGDDQVTQFNYDENEVLKSIVLPDGGEYLYTYYPYAYTGRGSDNFGTDS